MFAISQAHRVPVLGAGKRETRQPRRTVRPLAVATVAPPAAPPAQSVESLTELIKAKEAQMAALFEPSKPQPKAATVAALRKEIARLRGDLQTHLAGQQSAIPAPTTTAATASTSSPVAAAPTNSMSGSALNALRLVEALASRGFSLSSLSAQEQHEVLLMLEEQAVLKSELDYAQARLAQLQVLWETHAPAPAPAPASLPTATLEQTIVEKVLEPVGAAA